MAIKKQTRSKSSTGCVPIKESATVSRSLRDQITGAIDSTSNLHGIIDDLCSRLDDVMMSESQESSFAEQLPEEQHLPRLCQDMELVQSRINGAILRINNILGRLEL